MNDRKQHVLKTAHQLFIDKGFQATSIQDILDDSGISKGTFYNYFSSKNELLIAIFKSTYAKLEKAKNDLLIGQDRKDIDIFIMQIEMQMKSNRENKFISLLEEVMSSNDMELKRFIELERMKSIQWLFHRFIEIFGEKKKPYLLDCAIMFLGILRENMKFYHLAHEQNTNIGRVVRYSINRIGKMVDGLAESGEQLVQPELLDSWLPDRKNCDHDLLQVLHHSVCSLKKSIIHNEQQEKYMELLDFLIEELLDSKKPRKFLIESALLSLKSKQACFDKNELQKLERLVLDYFERNR